MSAFCLLPGELTRDTIQSLSQATHLVELDTTCWDRVEASEQYIKRIVEQNKVVYGVNTGFGLLANTTIPASQLGVLQKKLILSHATAMGEYLSDDVVRLVLLFKINSLAQGFSGVRRHLIELLIKWVNHGIYPCIPSRGSVGASGDLAPLAHLSLPLIGEGTVRYQGNIISGREALDIIGEKPIELAPKEGLALINGTQVSTAIALHYLLQAQRLLAAGVVIGALSVDAAKGSIAPFHPSIHEVRKQLGQIKVANVLRTLLDGSEILQSHEQCNRVQDPYSLRCQPQVLGACLDNLLHAQSILVREANAVTDNPLVFPELDTLLSGGNFHAEPVAQAADLTAIALSEIGAIAERRIALLVDPHFNGGLPAFLVQNGGVNSGFMIAHVTAAALASANKSLAHPASVDSIPTSANQEDHVSMATFAAFRLKDMVDNVEGILAVELLAACQGIDLRKPEVTSKPLAKIVSRLRDSVNFWSEDRLFYPDLDQAKLLVWQLGKEHSNLLFAES